MTNQTYQSSFEVIVVDDGSTISSKEIIKNYDDKLHLFYFEKENSGPGLSRNFGMTKATGDYFIILDSDCVLPKEYLFQVDKQLKSHFTDAYGGPDAAHSSFTVLQRAINYSMTSILTTGGIRGNKNVKSNFQPRSFNMGISKKAFNKTNGFSQQRFGEDIDLTFRLWKHKFDTQFIESAYVYHKRRSTWQDFFRQTFNFGAARPILNTMHKGTSKLSYWFPSIFVIGMILAFINLIFYQRYEISILYLFYFIGICFHSFVLNKSIGVAFMSIGTTCIQFFGYGLGFLRSNFRLHILQKTVEQTFPRMFS